MKRARHKKEKQVEAQATSAEQLHNETEGGDGAQPIVLEEHAPVDSREGEKRFLPEMTIYELLECQNSLWSRTCFTSHKFRFSHN